MENTAEILQQLRETLSEQMEQMYEATYKLREGDYYGDPLPDSLADIAKSLRILSGREQK